MRLPLDFCINFFSESDPFEKMRALMAENGGRMLGMFDELSSFLTKIIAVALLILPCFLSSTTISNGLGQLVSQIFTASQCHILRSIISYR